MQRMRNAVVHAPLFGAHWCRSTSILNQLNRQSFELGPACPEKENSQRGHE
jgi:hypothetical protein